MTTQTSQRTFQATEFTTLKEWIYFCLEFDLEICPECRLTARRRPEESEPNWSCGGCAGRRALIHPDLWEAITTRMSVTTTCRICRSTVDIRDCWISDDCQRLFCAEHARSVRVEERFRMARQFLQRQSLQQSIQRTSPSHLRSEGPRTARRIESSSFARYSPSTVESRSTTPGPRRQRRAR